VQPVKRGCHLSHRLPHFRVIREAELVSVRGTRLDEHTLGRRRRNVQLMQGPLTVPRLAWVKLRQALRSQHLPGQEGCADQAEPADNSCLRVPCAPEGDPLADRRATVPRTTRHSPM
jgi:hypothetical protein